MRQARWLALFTLLALVPQEAQAQRGDDRSGRRTARLMDRLRDEMWSYRQELNFFQRAPQYNDLVELRYRLRGLAIQVAEASENDPQAQRAAREMAQASRELYQETRLLEQRTDLGPREEIRRRADSLLEHAVEIRVLVGRLHEIVRLDVGDSRPGSSAGRSFDDREPGGPSRAPVGGGRPRDGRGDR